MTTPNDELRARFQGAADSIEPGDLSLDDVRATARRRNLRTRVGTVVGVVALVAGGTVAFVATGGDDPDTLVSTDPTIAESPESTVPVDDTVATTLPPPMTPGVTVEVVQQPGAVGRPVGVDGSPAYGEWSTPWRDGFLVGAQVFTPQPLPAELPEEVVALFPPEVVELFDGELPPTIDEASAMLSEAGLLDVVTDILAANPEASEAIYSAEVVDTEPTLDVRFTTDGVTWEPVEMTLPPGANYFNGVSSVGDRLAIAYPTTDPMTGMNVDGIVRVATTADLVNWDVQEVLTEPPPVTFPDGISWSTNVGGFAANESGWVLSVYSGVNVDLEALLPAEARDELFSSEDGGYGMYHDESGITVERTVASATETDTYTTVAGATETDTYTWEELGVAPEVAAYLGDQGYEPAMWVSTWGAAPTSAGVDTGYGQVVATTAGFLRVDDDVQFSPDGITWTDVELPIVDAYVSGWFAFDGGVVLLASDGFGGTQVIRVDETGGSPVVLDVPGLPPAIQPVHTAGSGDALLIDASDPGPPPPPLVVEYDGHRLTLDNVDGSIEIVDIASGEVVGETSFSDLGAEVVGNVVIDENEGVTVTDPTTGEVVVAIPADVLQAASDEQLPESEMEYSPDFWLLASRDGERFLLVDLDDGDEPGAQPFNAIASNGTKVLAQVAQEWVTYDLP